MANTSIRTGVSKHQSIPKGSNFSVSGRCTQETTVDAENIETPNTTGVGKFQAGALENHVDKWTEITSDSWVLETITGYKIDFLSDPFQIKCPVEIKCSDQEKDIVNNEIQEMILKGAVELVPSRPDQFLSNLFIVPKKNGSFRPVINLKGLNKFVRYEHFKQETFNYVLELLQPYDFLTSIDLKDAYFSIPIHPDYRKYLRFSWNNNILEFACLAFGLASAPRIFTKILKPVFATWFSVYILHR